MISQFSANRVLWLRAAEYELEVRTRLFKRDAVCVDGDSALTPVHSLATKFGCHLPKAAVLSVAVGGTGISGSSTWSVAYTAKGETSRPPAMASAMSASSSIATYRQRERHCGIQSVADQRRIDRNLRRSARIDRPRNERRVVVGVAQPNLDFVVVEPAATPKDAKPEFV